MKILKNRKLNFIVGTVLFVLLLIFFWFYNNGSREVSAAWWNDSWLYRQAIPVVNNTSAQTNVYISVTLDTLTASTSMQSDCGDFRFTREDGSLLPYYIVSGCRSAANVIHINFDSFPVGAQTVYFYYGNPSAENGFSVADFSTVASSYAIGATQAVEIGPGPVGYWSFDEGYGATAHDESGQGNDGAITGAVWKDESECISGKCLWFNGLNSTRIETETYKTMSELTQCVWLKANSLTNADSDDPIHLISHSWVLGFANTGILRFYVRTSGAYPSVYSTEALAVNKWYYVCGIFNGVGSVPKIYINGIDSSNTSTDDAGSGTIEDNTDQSLYIGANYNNLEDGNFNGFIDEVKIYPYARTADQIKQDYNAGLAGVKSNSGVAASFGGVSDKWLTDGLVGYWKFDEAVGIYDDDDGFEDAIDSSGNGNTGDAYGHASTTNGKFGNGAEFDGNTDGISVADTNNTLDMAEDLSVAFWINPDASATNELIDKANGGNGNYQIYQSNLNLVVRINGLGSFLTATNFLTLGTWSHALITYSRSESKVRIYKDGSLFASGNNTNAATLNDENLQIGAYANGTYSFDGQMDEIRIYNRALAPDEARKLYEWAPGPVAHWKFDEMEGATAFDSVASSSSIVGGNDVQVSGAAWAQGKYGGALSFNGADDYAEIPTLDFSGSDKLSIAFWLKTDVLETNNKMIFEYSADPSNDFYINMNEYIDGSVAFCDNTNASNWNCVYAAGTYADGAWHHFEIVSDRSLGSSQAKIYVDGVDDTVQSGSETYDLSGNYGSPIDWASASFLMSIGGTTEFVNGSLDDVRIYNYARTQKQILEDMNAGGPAVKSPVLHLSFDEGYGGTAHDSSIFGNDGLLYPGSGGDNTSSSSMWTKDGKVGGAMEFDGTDDYTNISDSRSLYSSGDVSISLWFKLNQEFNSSSPNGFIPFSLSDALSTNDLTFYMNNGTGKLSFQTYDSALRDLYTNKNQWAAGTWFNIIATLEDSKIKKLFINGEEEIAAAVSADRGTTLATVAYIGRSYQGYYFDGLIDEVKIWNYALSAEEVKSVYNQNSSLVVNSETDANNNGTSTTGAATEYCVPGDTSLCDGPVLEMKFDELSGTTTYDTSGNGNNGAVNGATWDIGKYGGALKFDGDDHVVIDDNSNQDTGGQLTVSHWFKADAGMIGKGMVMHDNSDYKYMTYMTSTSSVITFYVKTAAGTINIGYDCGPDNCFADGKWHHFSGTFNRTLSTNRAKVYIDGILETEGVGYDSDISSGDEGIYIGRWGSAYYSGYIDDVRIYNYARTPAQVAWDYNRGKPVGHWRFDECEGSTIHDYAGTNHGVLNLGATGVIATGTCASSSDSFWYNGRSGKYNAGGSFDGGDDYADMGDIEGIDGIQEITVSVWVKASTPFSGETHFVDKSYCDGSANAGLFELFSLSEGRARFAIYDNDGSPLYVDSGPSNTRVDDGSWHHVLGMWDSEREDSIIFIDGKEENSFWYSGITVSSNPSNYNLQIGGRCNGNPYYFPGQIDEVKIWNYALTPNQISQEYNGGAVRFGE
ncbi:MAG: DUF2341 domain-containing protein [Candidatus Falkowbacteria bacterium]